MLSAAILAAVVPASLFVASLGNPGLPAAVTEEADEVVGIWRFMLVLATALGVTVSALLLIGLWQFRRRQVRGEPVQFAGSVPVELTYTAIPLAIVAGLFVAGLRTDARVDAAATDDRLTVEVLGFQWGWQFDYPNGRVVTGDAVTAPELRVPVGRTTRLELRSADVIHSLFVPELLTKRDLIPGRTNHLDITPKRTGTFVGQCAEYCGLDHSRMPLVLTVMAGDEFDRWLATP